MRTLEVERPVEARRRIDPLRAAPTIVTGMFAAAYVIVSPPSFDLAAHMLRAKLFSAEGFGLWNNWWYAGHHTPGYSVLFPAASALLTPQLAGALAATATAVLFEPLARHRFGASAWLGSLWFGAATATNLYTGRLAFAFGLLPAVASALALQRRRWRLACPLAFLTALCSPVAALFVALAGAAHGLASYTEHRRLGAVVASRAVMPSRAVVATRVVVPGIAIAACALVPVVALAFAFPEGGSEPFAGATLWPVAVMGAVALAALPPDALTLRMGVVLYVLGCLVAYFVSTPVGSNAARLGPLLGGPLAALVWWPRHPRWLLAAALPLLYVQWQPPIRDVSRSADDPSAVAGYYKPLLSFLERQPGPPFRVEIPFTGFHWEAYEVAPRFPLARGWERQLDIKYNHLFYESRLTSSAYDAWLHQLAVRYVAVPDDVNLDYSAHRETKLIDGGLPYLRLVMRLPHWRVYAVLDPSPLVQGPATLRVLGPDSVTLRAQSPGRVLIRVHFTPYWTLPPGFGCVAPSGDFTELNLRKAGTVRITIDFSLSRIRSRAPRCRWDRR